MSSVITHELLYDILIKEKNREDLQSIEPVFFEQLRSYIEEKELILSSQKEKNSFPAEIQKTEKQLSTIKRLSEEVLERRKRKILNLALLNSRISSQISIKNLLPNEESLYALVLEALRNYSLHSTLKTKALKNQNPELLSVKFLDSLPQFLGTDNKIYGPFTKGDLAQLPKTLVNILIKKNKIEIMKDENP